MRTSDNPVKESVQKTKKTADEYLSEDSLIAQTVNLLIEDALANKASAVHIEPREDHILVRHRKDGFLREANKLPTSVLNDLVSRIKLLSNLKIDNRLRPQDSRFKIFINDQVSALSVSILPTIDGEKVVMRFLKEPSKAPSLEEVGYWGRSLDAVRKAITQPHGLILATGPAHSGKITTLFSLLSILNDSGANIATIESRIEYQLPGANQTQINPAAGITYINGLRTLLNQDPSVIMIGEIQDSKTAELAVHAAVSKRLVFSTVHTKNAAACFTSLANMGVESFLIASTVRAVIGQRLVRRLCEDCRESVEPDASTVKRMLVSLKISPAVSMKRIHELEAQALDAGIGKTKVPSPEKTSTTKLSSSETKILRIWRAHDGGCQSCNQTGYNGRLGVYEVLSDSLAIQKLVVGKSSSEVIQNQAVKEGMVTMQVDGFIKALRGQTSIEEVLRVTVQK